MASSLSRRRFLVSSGAAALLPALSGAATKRVRIRNTHSEAAAAGTIWIGGDLEVARIGLGTGGLAGDQGWGEPRDAAAARATLRRAVELGVNFLDTADVYGPTVSERLIREALHPYPSDLLIATKGGQIRMTREQFKELDGRPEHLRAACEASLKRLGLEQIALYQMHWPDPKVPYEDSVGELARLQKEGKIRHIGVCNVDLALLVKARSVATVVSVQNRYNVLDRRADEMLTLCERERIAFIPYMPLARREQANETSDSRLAGLQRLADERHVSFSQAALAWLLAKSPVMLPIPGTSRVDHLQENVAAAKIHITRAEMKRIG